MSIEKPQQRSQTGPAGKQEQEGGLSLTIELTDTPISDVIRIYRDTPEHDEGKRAEVLDMWKKLSEEEIEAASNLEEAIRARGNVPTTKLANLASAKWEELFAEEDLPLTNFDEAKKALGFAPPGGDNYKKILNMMIGFAPDIDELKKIFKNPELTQEMREEALLRGNALTKQFLES